MRFLQYNIILELSQRGNSGPEENIQSNKIQRFFDLKIFHSFNVIVTRMYMEKRRCMLMKMGRKVDVGRTMKTRKNARSIPTLNAYN